MQSLHFFAFQLRNLLAGFPLAFALFSWRWEWEHDGLIWALALTFCAGGITLRAWAACHCGYSRGRRKELATTGPYAYVRNPLYLGNLSVIAGATIASELAWLLPIALAWAILVYVAAVRHEETRLLEKYGEAFLRYREWVPAWIPDWRRFVGNASPALRAVLQQIPLLLVLVPFALKEINPFDLWPCP